LSMLAKRFAILLSHGSFIVSSSALSFRVATVLLLPARPG